MFFTRAVRKIDRGSNVDQELFRKVSPVCIWRKGLNMGTFHVANR